MDEFALIAELFAPLAVDTPGAFGLADDAAVLEVTEGRRLVATTDMMVAGLHFLPDDPPDAVARKLLRVNLSDLAAMGAAPRHYLLALAIPRDTADDWLRGFADGLAADQKTFRVALAGGDTVSTTGPFTASITALGEVEPGRELRRDGARSGDLVFVSGTIGDGALGLLAARGELAGVDRAGREGLIGRYRLPEPRVALGGRLAGVAGAAIDVSDGLVADVGHLCRCSGLGAVIEAASVPLSGAAAHALAADPSLRATVLAGGDDYELAFAVPAARAAEVADIAAELGIPLTAIGRMVDGEGVSVLDESGAEIMLASGGWQHR
jgi:thiamine-monophosphate kinase